MILCLVFFSAVLALFATASFHGILPFEYLLISPLTYFVISPIVKAIGSMEYLNETMRIINNRVPILVVILTAAYLLLKSG